MPVQRSQGRLRPMVPRADELPPGVAASSDTADTAAASEAATALRKTGDTVAAALLGSLGGRAKAARDKGLRVLDGLGLRGIPTEFLAPYLADAEAFAILKVSQLAAEVGGGTCGVGPSSIIQTAALQLAGSRAAFATGDLITGSRLGDASRANLLSAHELAAKEAAARPKSKVPSFGAPVALLPDTDDDLEVGQ